MQDAKGSWANTLLLVYYAATLTLLACFVWAADNAYGVTLSTGFTLVMLGIVGIVSFPCFCVNQRRWAVGGIAAFGCALCVLANMDQTMEKALVRLGEERIRPGMSRAQVQEAVRQFAARHSAESWNWERLTDIPDNKTRWSLSSRGTIMVVTLDKDDCVTSTCIGD